ncbi:uncharacterized protein LOC136093427 [Hydra vulgaris]|uniref:uncharacterized protein LOC136093427 n=1 Tax=Hydra vulgaris TaxID=6087 RepID=UPI0032EA1C3F
MLKSLKAKKKMKFKGNRFTKNNKLDDKTMQIEKPCSSERKLRKKKCRKAVSCINYQMVIAFREIGQGYQGIPSESMSNAALETKSLLATNTFDNNSITNCQVSVDGTWQMPQFASKFKRNNSIEHAIIHLTRSITDSFEKSGFTLGVFIDLSKAFDTIDHEILFKKLEHYGISGNGSILEPLLLLIYVNDLYEVSKITTIMFADDTNLFLSNNNINKLFYDMNIELTKISDWFKSNKLSLNIDKTKWIFFHPQFKKHLLPSNIPLLHIDNIQIKRVTFKNVLGILVEENLSWKITSDIFATKLQKALEFYIKQETF